MRSDYEPIIFNTDPAFSEIEIYAIHDLHVGSAQFNKEMWERMKAEILEHQNRFCVFVGDLMENATVGSKSDVYSQTMPPQEQKEYIIRQFEELKDRVIGIVDGNHEKGRAYKSVGLFPLYDCALIAGLQERYRNGFAVCDIGVGTRDRDKKQQVHYVLYLVHKAKEGKGSNTALATSGVDVICCGHTHMPQDVPKAQLNYNPINKVISVRPIELLNCGSWLDYGGYAIDSGYLPNSLKKYKMILHGGTKKIETLGFYI